MLVYGLEDPAMCGFPVLKLVALTKCKKPKNFKLLSFVVYIAGIFHVSVTCCGEIIAEPFAT